MENSDAAPKGKYGANQAAKVKNVVRIAETVKLPRVVFLRPPFGVQHCAHSIERTCDEKHKERKVAHVFVLHYEGEMDDPRRCGVACQDEAQRQDPVVFHITLSWMQSDE